MVKITETCKNCEKDFKKGFKFCPYCGQQAKDILTVKVLFYNTISNYFSFDARFFKSFFPLLFKPGYLAERFIEGKRLLYLHPAQMYLFVTVVFFFLFSFIQRKQVQSLDEKLAKTIKGNSSMSLAYSQLKDSIAIDAAIKDSVSEVKVKETLYKTKTYTSLTDKEIDSIAAATTHYTDNDGVLYFSFDETVVDSLIAAKVADKEIYKHMGMEDDDGWFTKRLYAQALKFYKSRQGGSILQAFYDTIPMAM